MRKDSRLSFRISKEIKKKINKAIEKSEGQIRDHSEFGTRAVKFYLNYIENSQATKELMLEAVIALADKTDVKSLELDKIKEILETRTIYPSKPISGKTVEDHPLIEEIGELRKKLDENDKEKLDRELVAANYNDVEKIYEKYKKKLDK